jgi:hypothetical protein
VLVVRVLALIVKVRDGRWSIKVRRARVIVAGLEVAHRVVDELKMRPKRLGEGGGVAVFVIFTTSDFSGDTLVGAVVDFAHNGILSRRTLRHRGSV